jgi:UDP-glucuronate decarboxylase
LQSGDHVTGPINLGNPEEFNMLQLAEEIIKQTNSKSKLIQLDLPQDDPKQRKPNINKAREILDWNPTIALEEGLSRTISDIAKRL